MTGTRDEAGLIQALTQGERRAMQQLVARFGPGLRSYARQMLRNPDDGEDVVQEVFLRAWKHAGRYDPARAAPSTWLYRIAVNLCIDRNRRVGLRRLIGLDDAPEIEEDRPDPDRALDARDRLAATQAAIRALPERQARALMLRAAGEMNTAEIAATLEISPGAVEQLLVRARASLRRAVTDDHEKGDQS